jgi:hypothetical protein
MTKLMWGSLLVSLAAQAHAADEATLGKVRAYHQAATQAYDAGQFDIAAKAWEEALALVPDHPSAPALMFSAAQAHRRQYAFDQDTRDLTRSLELYRRYLDAARDGPRRIDAIQFISEIQGILARRAPSDPVPAEAERTQILVTSRAPGALARIDGGALGTVPMALDVSPGEHKVEVEAPGYFSATSTWLALKGRLVVSPVDLEARPAMVRIAAPDDSRIFVDGVHLGRAPLGGPAQIPAGEHLLTVTASGHSAATRRLDLERGQALSVAIREMPATNQRVASVLVMGGAGAAAVAGVITGLLAYDRQNEALSVKPATHPGSPPSAITAYNDAVGARNSLRSATYALLGSAAALGITGLMLYGLDAPDVPAPPITVHGLTASAEGAGR